MPVCGRGSQSWTSTRLSRYSYTGRKRSVRVGPVDGRSRNGGATASSDLDTAATDDYIPVIAVRGRNAKRRCALRRDLHSVGRPPVVNVIDVSGSKGRSNAHGCLLPSVLRS